MKGSLNVSSPICEMKSMIKRNKDGEQKGNTRGDRQAARKYEGLLQEAICGAATE